MYPLIETDSSVVIQLLGCMCSDLVQEQGINMECYLSKYEEIQRK